jgi:translation initiation factor eIF-2B subunit delta
LSGAELKAQKKAEKAARRQQEAQARQAGSAGASSTSHIVPSAASTAGSSSPSQQAMAKGAKAESGAGQHKRSGSMLGMAAKGSHSNISGMSAPDLPIQEDKTVELFRHLYKPRATTIAHAAKEVHPAVLALGQQMRSYTVCGSNARLVATLQAFKRVSLDHESYFLFLSLPLHTFQSSSTFTHALTYYYLLLRFNSPGIYY